MFWPTVLALGCSCVRSAAGMVLADSVWEQWGFPCWILGFPGEGCSIYFSRFSSWLWNHCFLEVHNEGAGQLYHIYLIFESYIGCAPSPGRKCNHFEKFRRVKYFHRLQGPIRDRPIDACKVNLSVVCWNPELLGDLAVTSTMGDSHIPKLLSFTHSLRCSSQGDELLLSLLWQDTLQKATQG